MKPRAALLLVLFFALAACASGGSDNRYPVTLLFAPDRLNVDQLRYSGPVAIHFQFEITNGGTETITLRSIELRSIAGGPFAIRTSSNPMNKVIAPGQTATASVTAWARSAGNTRLQAEEPVTVRAAAYFDAPSGSFLKVAHEQIGAN